MNTKKHMMLLATVAAAVLVVGMISVASLNGASFAYADKEQMQHPGSSMTMTAAPSSPAKGAALGTISSIQNDEKGQPAWIAAGGWKLFLMPSESKNNSTTSAAPDAKFSARFIMTKLDGTSKHEHAISDFVLTNMSDDGNTTTLTGNATMTMKDAPQKNIPMTIKIMNHNIISIMLDPHVNSHLGNTPLYGTVLRANNGYHTMAHMGENETMMSDNSNSSDKDKEKSSAKEEGRATTIDIVSGAANKGDKSFSPNPVAIKAGTEVTWKNADSALHTVTSGKNSTPDNVFDSSILAPKKDFTFKFNSAGTYDYFCQLHPTMIGEVTVT
jgi:plastocyanin